MWGSRSGVARSAATQTSAIASEAGDDAEVRLVTMSSAVDLPCVAAGRHAPILTRPQQEPAMVERERRPADGGQTLAEYALILALIAILAVLALLFLGGQINTLLSDVGNSI
jgi:Flp pilus assembly pilin Flp